MSKKISKRLVEKYKQMLLEKRQEISNHFVDFQRHMRSREASTSQGDEGDQSLRVLEESRMADKNFRLKRRLEEIDSALKRIDKGSYGLCRETGEPIDSKRLDAVPWTERSSEGHEINEELPKRKKFPTTK